MPDTENQPHTLVALRHASGKSQRQVSELMGVTKGRVSQIERDFPNIRFDVMQAYIRALGGRIRFSYIGGIGTWSDEIERDPRSPRSHGDRTAVRSGADRHPGTGDQ